MPNASSKPSLVWPRWPARPALLTSPCSGRPRSRNARRRGPDRGEVAEVEGEEVDLGVAGRLLDLVDHGPRSWPPSGRRGRRARPAWPARARSPCRCPSSAPVTMNTLPFRSLMADERSDVVAAGATGVLLALRRPSWPAAGTQLRVVRGGWRRARRWRGGRRVSRPPRWMHEVQARLRPATADSAQPEGVWVDPVGGGARTRRRRMGRPRRHEWFRARSGPRSRPGRCSPSRRATPRTPRPSRRECGQRQRDDAPEKSLFERLGGKDAIVAVVDDFVANVGADDRINAFFANADIPHLKQMLVDQICQATGGPCQYGGKTMAEAHKGMGVKQEHFDALVEDLDEVARQVRRRRDREERAARRARQDEARHRRAVAGRGADRQYGRPPLLPPGP